MSGEHATTTAPWHPLAPLTAAELQKAAGIIKASWPAHTDLHFKVVTLQEPPKTEVLKYLEAEHGGKPLPSIPRKAFVNYYIRNTVCRASSVLCRIRYMWLTINQRVNSTRRLSI